MHAERRVQADPCPEPASVHLGPATSMLQVCPSLAQAAADNTNMHAERGVGEDLRTGPAQLKPDVCLIHASHLGAWPHHPGDQPARSAARAQPLCRLCGQGRGCRGLRWHCNASASQGELLMCESHLIGWHCSPSMCENFLSVQACLAC